MNMCACMYTQVYLRVQNMWNVLKAVYEVEDMDAPWIEGWRACEQAGSLAMPKRGNQDMQDDHSPALC